ncbi:MAG: fibronectin type III domain-containing protein, partial [Proteiniphilum sp.]|nr:fibronectin type III domain-containing protein [Proteiniphilum sp.]
MKVRSILIACLLIVMLPGYSISLQQNDQKNSPSEIMLTIGGDPTSEYSVTWRTSGKETEAVAEIIKAVPHPKFGKDATVVKGSTVTEYGESKDRNSHKVRFSGLQPDTRYSYRVGNGKVWSEWFQFSTAKKEKEPFSFIYLGDVQNDIKSLGSRTLRQAYTHLGHEASFMLFVGDLVSRSTDEYWSEFFYAGGWMLGSLPSVAVAGNHEYKGKVFSPHWSHLFGM